ncbi:MAG: energy transducer TonB [Spirochaetaceae bacterium]|jgi:protein TonB|nr:energy transducer TonB [Spirochaetaceae bacterium]
MKSEEGIKDKLRRGGVLAVVAALHIFLLFFIVFTVEVTAGPVETIAAVMKLADIEEETPPPPPQEAPPPPPLLRPSPPALVKKAAPVEQEIIETIAETVIEVDEAPVVEVAVIIPSAAPVRYTEEYLPQNKVSVLPQLDERDIRSRLVYPPIALRSGLEGIVYLELYIDRDGQVRRVVILKENPAGRGFGEAAIKAFEGLRGKPAQANGESVAVRYRYPVRFQIK